MNTQTNEHRLQELEEENELLLLQLHQVQEELERYYLRNQELEKGGVGEIGNTIAAHGWVDEQVPETLAETARLNTLLATQTYLQRIESTRALNARLGNMLIQSASQGGSLLSVPGKLLKIWRESEKDAIPAALGGKSGDKVIAAYRKGGLEAVNGLLTDINAPVVKANVYTLLARQLRNEDWDMTAQLARLAYEEDPRPYRLKWLAFRLYEAGEIAEADAMLALLPEDTTFSDSELRQQDQIRYEANSIRLREAKQTTNFDHRRQAIEGQLKQLQQEHTTQTNLAIERQQRIETLQHEQVQLEQEKESLEKRHKEAVQLVESYNNDLAILRKEKTELVKEIEQFKQNTIQKSEENELLLTQLHRVQEELEHFHLDKKHFEQEKNSLAKQQKEIEELVAVRDREIEKLKQIQAHLEQEKIVLIKHHEDARELTNARDREIGELKQGQTQLEQEKVVLAKHHEKARELISARDREIMELKQVQNKLEQEKIVLTKHHEKARELISERDREVGELRQTQVQLGLERAELAKHHEKARELITVRDSEVEKLQQEKIASTKQLEEADKLAAARLKQIGELQKQIQNYQASETELASRQQMMQEEMVRAEAQIDLIKDLLLQEAGI